MTTDPTKAAADVAELTAELRMRDAQNSTDSIVWRSPRERLWKKAADALDAQRREIERIRSVAINLNAAIDAMWHDPTRYDYSSRFKYEKSICAAQRDLKAALTPSQEAEHG